MSLNRCPFCQHGNPEDSKFCGECGGALHLVPCPRCGAVSQVTATVCYQCHGRLPGRGAEATDSSAPAADISRSLPRWPSRAIVGTAAVAAIAVLGYYTYRQRTLVDAPLPPAASSEAGIRSVPAAAGVIGLDAAGGDAKSGKAGNSTGLTNIGTSPSVTPLATPARAAPNPPGAGRQPVESQKAKTAAAAISRPQAINAGKASERGPSRPDACTEAVAALGLCVMTPVQKKGAETAATVAAAVKRAQASDAGKAGGREPPRPQSCTEAVAALGLCAPTTTQGRE